MSKKFSLSERFASFRFAWKGIRSLLVEEHNARIHLIATIAVMIAGFVAGLDADEWRWVMLAILLVWLTEAINTAIERLGDAITKDHHPQIGLAKDISAAAVLISSLFSVLIGISIFAPYLIAGGILQQ